MKTEWDYTGMATAYLKRPDYAPDALEQIYRMTALTSGDTVCDVGAGVAHLTLPLAKHGLCVDAVEPNDDMRALGTQRTKDFPHVMWFEGTGEASGRPSGVYDAVTFGSSFAVCDRAAALRETYRLLKPQGYFVCLWNHRNLGDPIQKGIETIIKTAIPGYAYGTRRENQTDIIAASGLFEPAQTVEGHIQWRQDIADIIEAWRSHATLQRQAGPMFADIVQHIADYLHGLGGTAIEIPYTTRAWIARRKG